MSQHDYNIANGGGAAVRADINAALAAILSVNSGPTAPAATAPYMPWNDTASGELKMRNAADTGWVPAAQAIGAGPGALLNIRIFTSNATYTKTPGTNKRIMYIQGGGGAGAGAVATGAGQSSLAGSGNSGFLFQILSTYDWDGANIVVGAQTASTGAGLNGATGNASSITKGSYNYTANGGGGGTAGAASATFPRAESNSGSGGSGTFSAAPGDVSIPVFGGKAPGGCVSIASGVNFIPAGGTTMFGGAQADRWGSSFFSGYGSTYGGGGYGGANGPSTAAKGGGPGLQGLVIIYEYA